MHEEKATEGQVDRLGKRQILDGLGQGEDLGVLGRRLGNEITGSRVDVDGVDATVSADDLAEGDRHVAETGTDIDATPPWPHAEARQCGGQRSPVDVVTQVPHVAENVVSHAPSLAHLLSLRGPGCRLAAVPDRS